MHETAETTTETLHARTDFDAGHRIDRYELRELIGRGGMGSVYRAIDTKLGRTVAVKTVAGRRGGARLTDRVRQRFLREAMALSKVEHRNVVQVLDFGFADDGTPFLIMEHLHGRDLGALLAASERPLPVTDVVDIMLGVCAALRACHRAGIIHRDLKPGNIFLAETDTGREVKVLDFGVSKAPTADDLTREGQILGRCEPAGQRPVRPRCAALRLSHFAAPLRGPSESRAATGDRGRQVRSAPHIPARSARGAGRHRPPCDARDSFRALRVRLRPGTTSVASRQPAKPGGMAKLLPAALPRRGRTGCGRAGEDADPRRRRGCRIGERRGPV